MDATVSLEDIKELAAKSRARRLAEKSDLQTLYVTNDEWNDLRREFGRNSMSELPTVLFGLPVVIDERKAAERKATLGW